MSAPILACTTFGMPVAIDGASDRLADLGVVRSREEWRIGAVRTHRRELTFTGWSAGRVSATASSVEIDTVWLREALFDRAARLLVDRHQVLRGVA